jgi:hypothetical protein
MPTFIYNQLNMINWVQCININTSICQSTLCNSTLFHYFLCGFDKYKGKRKKKKKLLKILDINARRGNDDLKG